jgi:pilus assembly protein CpaC
MSSSAVLRAEDPPPPPPPNPNALNEDDYRTIAVGTTDWLDFDFEPKVTIGKQDVMKGEIDPASPRRVKLSPLKKGTTSVDIQDQKGKLVRRLSYNVIATELSQKVMAIRRLLYDIEGITIESVDEKIVIDGELIVPRDFDRILQVQQAYPEVLNLVTLSKVSRDAIAKRMQREINDDPEGVNVIVSIKNDTFFLLGKVDSTDAKNRAEFIALTYLPETINSPATKDGVLIPGAKKFSIRNLIDIEEPPSAPPPKMVRVTYHFVEIGKDFLKSSFFKWSPLLSEQSGLTFGQGTAGGVASAGSFNGTLSNLIPKLQSGANGGFARILFSTVAIGLDNQEMEILRTDNIPFIAANANGVLQQDNAPISINVKTKPQITGEDKVTLENTVQFQALSGAASGGGKPRSTSTTLRNSVILKSGDSAALGGLISSDTAKDIDKDPEGGGTGGTAGNPLFSLLRSKAFRNKKTQFVVFLTPKIISDASEGTADIKAKILNNSQKKRRRVIR